MFYLVSNGNEENNTIQPTSILADTLKVPTPKTEQKFHLGDIISVIGRYVVSPTGTDGVEKLITHVTGMKCPSMRLGNLETIQFLERASEFSLAARLSSTLPLQKIREDVEELKKTLDTISRLRPILREKAIKSWLAQQVRLYGETFTV